MKHAKVTNVDKSPLVPDQRLFVTPREIGAVFGKSPGNICHLIATGQLPGQRVGGRYYMHREDFNKLIARPGPMTIAGASVHTERPDAA